jgi:hypothetical protein
VEQPDNEIVNNINKIVTDVTNCIYYREFSDEFASETIEKFKQLPIEEWNKIDISLAFNLFRVPYIVRKELISYVNAGTRSSLYTDDQDIDRILVFSDIIYNILYRKICKNEFSHIVWNSSFIL